MSSNAAGSGPEHGAGEDFVEVRLVGLPIDEYRSSQQHHDGLFRELAIIALNDTDSEFLPRRLLELIEELRTRYSGLTAAQRGELEEAMERGETSIDLRYEVPVSVGDACRGFAALLEEADEFCRQGDLLTLAPPPQAVHFRRWYLGEFIRQVEGREPTPWRPMDASAGVEGTSS